MGKASYSEELRFAAASALLVVMVCVSPNEGNLRQDRAKHSHCLDNRNFSDNLLFEVPAVSNIHCSVSCFSDQSCEAFTYIPTSATCQGHSSVPTSASPSFPSPGAKTFVLPEGKT
ncbi:hypothetical protein BaRGS_00018772 [Batillaria attramentaria]|uniref:Apple domain-containing protein n=1 Tax=Batillaria attramentaria TaxID=370345 RepID=A0ABD0KSP1_9CAEN